VIGPLQVAPPAGALLVVNNTGSGSGDAYGLGNVSAIASATATKILILPKQFPTHAPDGRFAVVGTPVTLACAANALIRATGYAMHATQPINISAAPLSGAAQSIIATGFDCTSSVFRIEAAAAYPTGELVSWTSASSGSIGSVRTYHAWQVRYAQ
jgi:hypothetical protein